MLNGLALQLAVILILPPHVPIIAVLHPYDASQSKTHSGKPNEPQNPPTTTVVNPKNPNPQQCPTCQCNSQPAQYDDHYVLWGIGINALLTLVTLAIAIAGIVQAIASKSSADVTQPATRFTETTVKNSERAEVLASEAST